MLRNYIKIIWRNALRYKTQSLMNTLGLALGITCYLLISIWAKEEEEKDNFHQNGDGLYTTYLSYKGDGKVEGTYASPYKSVDKKVSMLLQDAALSIPEITLLSFYATGYELPWGHPETFQVGDKKVKLSGSRVSSNFFKLFSYPLLQGKPENALNDMKGIAISRKMAEIFFASPENAMGKTLRYENKEDFTVNAVFENVGDNSSLQFDFLFNWDAQTHLLEWASANVFTYLQVADNAKVKDVEKKLDDFLQSRLDKTTQTTETHLGLQRFGDQYLYNQFVHGKPTSGRIESVRVFKAVALFILVIACINFMNLATARSMKRAKEIGLRKVVGCNRLHLIGQFLGESLFFSFLAMGVSLLLLLLALPLFNLLIDANLAYPFFRGMFWLNLAAVAVLTGLFAGLYPAWYLSSFQPVQILKGITHTKQGSLIFRRVSTIFQFTLASLLILATLIISRQMNFIQHTDIGYDRNNLVYIRIEGELATYNKYRLFKERALTLPGIDMVDRNTEAPHEMTFEVTDPVQWQGKKNNDQVPFKPASVGFDYIKLMKLRMVEGRDFSNDITTDSADAFLVNQEAVKQMGLEDPIGKWVSAWGKKGHIIGVMADFHTQSLRDPIKPVMLDVKEYEYFGFIIVRTKPGQTRQALNSLEKLYGELNPNYPFSYQFVDQEYKNLYRSELLTSKLSTTFSILSIMISCFGLLGLIIFATEQRTKEIGIRKVLGASIQQIVRLLSIDFLKLVCVAQLIALPIGYMLLYNWLEHFSYRVQIPWWIGIFTCLLTLLIAQMTLSFQAIKAALMNPTKTIRNE